MLGIHHTAVSTVRKELERRGEISHVATRTDTLGRRQPSRKHITKQHIPEEADVGEALSFAKAVRQ